MLKKDRTILIVDDEKNILSSLTRIFRRCDLKVLRANSGKEGIEILKENTVGVIISDQRMPEMSGVEFLSQVKETHPDTIRIVLSGYTDLKSITNAINDGAIYKFLTKPWDDDLLLKNVEEAFERYEMKLENESLTKKLKEMNRELELANNDLNKDVEINHHVLNVSQEVLENMPAGIMGIADDGLIAITNKMSEEWFSGSRAAILGGDAVEILPKLLYKLYERVKSDGKDSSETITIHNSLKLDVRCKNMGVVSDSNGTILVMTQVL